MGTAIVVPADDSTNPPELHICRGTQRRKVQNNMVLGVKKSRAWYSINFDAIDDDFPLDLKDHVIHFLVANLEETYQDHICIYLLLLEPVPESVGHFKRVGLACCGELEKEFVEELMNVIKNDGANIPSLEYMDVLHTIRLY